MKLMKVLFVAAIVVAIAAPTFAAVQNIKVSGSIEERAIYLNNFDLAGKSQTSTNQYSDAATWPGAPLGSGESINNDESTFVLQTVHVGVDSDLTDNVSASVVLSNQTQWGSADWTSSVLVNKAFITLKEFFYQPLTVRVGRQDLKFGSGFIVGPGIFRDPNGVFNQPTMTNIVNQQTGLAVNNYPFSGPLGLQYTDATYYDAVRATVDLDPWTVDVIYSKINNLNWRPTLLDNNETGSLNEELAGLNVAYKFDQYNAKAEAYYFFKNNPGLYSDMGLIDPVDLFASANTMAGVSDVSVVGTGARIYDREDTHVFGMRGDIIPVENLSLTGEGAVQWGHLNNEIGPFNPSTNGGALDRKKLAWTINAYGDYTWKDVSYKPNLGLGVEYLSGEEKENNGKWNAWDPMFRGNSLSMIRGYMGGQQAALNNQGGNIYTTLDPGDPSGSTDAITLYVDGGLKPMDDLTIKMRYLHFWTAQKDTILWDGTTGAANITQNRSRSLGDEIDTTIVYDYTEDVQFDLTGGVFIPGNFYDDNADLNAPLGVSTKSTSLAVVVTTGVKVAF